MSILKITITENHIKLLKQLRWSLNDKNQVVGVGHDGDEEIPPFGEDNLYEAIDIILNGVPENFDPFTSEEPKEYSDEQKAEWDKLYSELPLCLDVLLYNGKIEVGNYKTKYHLRDWKKIPV